MPTSKRIKLIRDVPVEPKHGLNKGKIFKTVQPPKGYENKPGYWVKSKVGEKVRVWAFEASVIHQKHKLKEVV